MNVFCTVKSAYDARPKDCPRSCFDIAILDAMRMPESKLDPYSCDPPRYLYDNALTQLDSRIFAELTSLTNL